MSNTPQDNRSCREDLAAYLDGELSPKREAEIRQRLREDPDLAREAGGLDRAWRLLDHLPRPTADESAADDTMTRIRLADLRLARRRRWGWAAGLASAAAVLLAVTLWTPQTPQSIGPSQDLIRNLETVQVIQEHLKVAWADHAAVTPDRIAAELEFVEALDALGVFGEETTN
jgi:anti-sigma factor RsiW